MKAWDDSEWQQQRREVLARQRIMQAHPMHENGGRLLGIGIAALSGAAVGFVIGLIVGGF